MGFRLKAELRGLPHAADFNILFVRGADGHIGIGEIWNRSGELEHFFLDGPQSVFFVFDVLGYSLHFIALFRHIDFLPDELRNFLRSGVPLLPEPLYFIDDALAFPIKTLKKIHVEYKSPVGKLLAGCFDVLAQIIEVEHEQISLFFSLSLATAPTVLTLSKTVKCGAPIFANDRLKKRFANGRLRNHCRARCRWPKSFVVP